MRFVLGALLLLASFALATRWQTRWTEELRSERDRTFARQELPSDDRAPVLGRVIVGLQSGAPAFEGADGSRPPPTGGAIQPETSAGMERSENDATKGAETGAAGAGRRASLGPDPESGGQSAQPSVERVFELTVQRGEQLGELCRKHYGTGRRELVDAIARYNHMANPDQLREGQRLLLPPLETLLGVRR